MIPRRAYDLRLHLGADTKDELLKELQRVIEDVKVDASRVAVGGVSSGYSLELDIDTEITHEKYVRDLEQHLAERA